MYYRLRFPVLPVVLCEFDAPDALTFKFKKKCRMWHMLIVLLIM